MRTPSRAAEILSVLIIFLGGCATVENQWARTELMCHVQNRQAIQCIVEEREAGTTSAFTRRGNTVPFRSAVCPSVMLSFEGSKKH